MVLSSEGTPMFTFMLAGEDSESIQQAHRRMIIVGVDDSAEAEAAAKWAVREAELRKDDLLLVHVYEVPLSPRGRPAALRLLSLSPIAHGVISRRGRPCLQMCIDAIQ
jgi:hypothetical protein